MTFRLVGAYFDGNDLRFSERTVDSLENYVTVVIGKNGVGKSRLLSAITRTFEAIGRDDWLAKDRRSLFDYSSREADSFSLSFEMNGIGSHLVVNNGKIQHEGIQLNPEVQELLPRRVIASSTSPYDKFPVPRGRGNSNVEEEKQRYVYLGAKERSGVYSSLGLLSRVADSLLFAANSSSQHLQKLSHVFQFLGYSPRISAIYRFEISPHRFLEKYASEGVDGLVKMLSTWGRRWSSLRFETDDRRIRQVVEAYAELRGESIKGRELAFDVDFEKGSFTSGSLRMFEHTNLLRNLGLMRLIDIRLTPEQEASFQSFSIRDASSGEQCILATILGIAGEIEDYSLICIDEPEISLHPEWQERFVELLLKTFSTYSGCHFIIATHSPQILSRIGSKNCSILRIDEHRGELLPSVEFYRKSADFQLANALAAPGFSNEYLARECLVLVTKLGSGEQLDVTSHLLIEKFRKLRPLLQNEDPVAGLMDAIFAAATV